MPTPHQDTRQVFSSIGIMGYGAFGRLMARHLRHHLPLRIHDPAATVPVLPGQAPAGIAEVAACDVVILAMPVDRLAAAIADLCPHLRAGTIVVDVGSVKIEPARIMLESLPEDVDILGTHPLFGPQSAANGLAGLKIALCPIRGGSPRRIAAFLRRMLRLDVVMTTPDAHDRDMAMVQGLTHLVAKILVRMEPMPSRMTTRSFELLMQATEMVRHDAPGVFQAIERANPHARGVRERFLAHVAELTADFAHAEPVSGAAQTHENVLA